MKDDLKVASKLINDFNSFIDKRSGIFMTLSYEMLDSILQWHFEMWEKRYGYLESNDKLDEWVMYDNLSRSMDSIFEKIEMHALKENNSFTFFKKLEKHAEIHKKVDISSHSYNTALFQTFYQIFFQHIYEARDRFSIWNHYFPSQWKITKDNLQNPENVISEVSYDNFIAWARSRILQMSEEKDFALNDVLTNLFPEVDPILWGRILIFIFTEEFDIEDPMRSVVKRPWNIGFMGRVKVYHGSQENEVRRINNNERKNTYDLSFFLFSEQFSELKLESYIKSLGQLSYSEEPIEESKRQKLYHLFTDMLDYSRTTKIQ